MRKCSIIWPLMNTLYAVHTRKSLARSRNLALVDRIPTLNPLRRHDEAQLHEREGLLSEGLRVLEHNITLSRRTAG